MKPVGYRKSFDFLRSVGNSPDSAVILFKKTLFHPLAHIVVWVRDWVKPLDPVPDPNSFSYASIIAKHQPLSSDSG